MLRVTIDLVPYGVGEPEHLHTIEIANDGTGDSEHGNYKMRVGRAKERDLSHMVWGETLVHNFPRQKRNAVQLLRLLLKEKYG